MKTLHDIKTSNRKLNIHFLILFITIFFVAGNARMASADESYRNPFKGKKVVAVADGSSRSLAGLAVLLGVKECPVKAVLVIQTKDKKRVRDFLKENTAENILVSLFDSGVDIPVNDSTILVALVPYHDIPVSILKEKPWFRIVVFDASGGDIDRAGTNAVDVILSGGNLSLPLKGILPSEYQKKGLAAAWYRLAYKEHVAVLQYEVLAAYLLFPEVFDMRPVDSDPLLAKSIDYDAGMIKGIVAEILTGQYRPGEGVALAGFPTDPLLYKYDVRAMMNETIAKYGLEEWKACVLTDEIHGHLGIYSIVGAKMGILAREYFHAETDKLRVTTYGGSSPPESCLNDGLQASTGATIGQGLIRVASVQEGMPEADFTFGDKTIRIRLKEEYRKQIESDISRGIVKYGLLNAGYWKMVRVQAIDYWKNWDRNLIFEIIELPTL